MNDISHLTRHLNKKHLGLATAVSSRYPRMASLLSHIELGMFAKTEECKKDEYQGKLESYFPVSSQPDQNSVTHEENASEKNEICILQGDDSDDSDEYSKVIGNHYTQYKRVLTTIAMSISLTWYDRIDRSCPGIEEQLLNVFSKYKTTIKILPQMVQKCKMQFKYT